MEIVKEIYNLTKEFPKEERYLLKAQMIRSAISIPSNIAEGTGRKSRKDFSRYLEISQGSCFELKTQLIIAKWNISSNKKNMTALTQLVQEEQKMLRSFIKRLIPKEKLETNN